MRIACIHLPQYALQCATRVDPSLRGAALAVATRAEGSRTGPLHAPIIVACSRAAWALGVRLGMTATAARGIAPTVQVVGIDAAIERETMRAIAEAILGLTGAVEVGGRVGAGGAHLALYAEVPSKTRGTSFGDRVLERLDELGLTGRVGIADDRFTAWVAAAHGAIALPGARRDDDRAAHANDVIAVPRGGSAAFLAPRPLSLLAISAEVQHMLEALGVRTLGEFAALPAPSVARPLEADYQALARGESGARIRPYAPEAAIREDIVITAGNVLDAPGSLSGPTAITLLARRIALRLAGRNRGAVRLELHAGDAEPTAVVLDYPIVEADELARVLGRELTSAITTGSWRLRAIVAGEAPMNATTMDDAVAASPFQVTEPGELRNLAEHHHDPLAVVLSTSGSLFALSPPDLRAERRDAHRRTRRGKQRRERPAAMIAQARLFDRG